MKSNVSIETMEFLKNNVVISNHYGGAVETIFFIEDKLTSDQFIGYCLGNVIKYISRYNNKGENIADLQKALTYLIWTIEHKVKKEDEEDQDQDEKKNGI